MNERFDFMFNVIPIIVVSGFIIILGVVLKSFIEGLLNSSKPKIPINATVISKRMEISYGHNDMDMSNNYTTYYVGFEFINGDMSEFAVKGSVYNLLIEGDKGILTIQGSRFIDFNRS